MEMEEKKNELTEAALPVQELPADIPDEVRQKLVRDLNEEATEDLKQAIREAERNGYAFDHSESVMNGTCRLLATTW